MTRAAMPEQIVRDIRRATRTHHSAEEKISIVPEGRRTLERFAIPRHTFYRWYDCYVAGELETLEDRSSRPGKVRNRIPADVRDKVIDLALDEPVLSQRELAVRPRSSLRQLSRPRRHDHKSDATFQSRLEPW